MQFLCLIGQKWITGSSLFAKKFGTILFLSLYLEIIAESQEVEKNHTKMSHVSFKLLPSMVT